MTIELGTMASHVQRCMKKAVKMHLTKDDHEDDSDFRLGASNDPERSGDKKFRPKRAASSRAMNTLHKAFHDEVIYIY